MKQSRRLERRFGTRLLSLLDSLESETFTERAQILRPAQNTDDMCNLHCKTQFFENTSDALLTEDVCSKSFHFPNRWQHVNLKNVHF